MNLSRSWLRVCQTRFYLVVWLYFVVISQVCSCSSECVSSEAHLQCSSLDLAVAARCDSSVSASYSHCQQAIEGKTSTVTKEWVSAEREGAWILIDFVRNMSVTKLIIQQRAAEAAQIKIISIAFDQDPKIEVFLSRNINGSVFDEFTFPSRVTRNLTLAVLSMFSRNSGNPGFRKIKIYDENCDRGYHAVNSEIRPRSNNPSLVRSWTLLSQSALKMHVSFKEQLNVVFSIKPTAFLSDSYTINLDTVSNAMTLSKGDGNLMANVSFDQDHSTYQRPLWFLFHGRKIVVGGTSGILLQATDNSLLMVKYWGVSSSSLQPIKIMFWRPIGLCHSTADYYWLADKALGGTTIPELQKGFDGKLMDIEGSAILPYGPHIDGQISSALYLSGASDPSVELGEFTEGCLFDLSQCTEGITLAFWVSFYDLSPSRVDNDIFYRSGIVLLQNDNKTYVFFWTSEKYWSVSVVFERTSWHYVVFLWDAVRGLKVLVDNVKFNETSVGYNFHGSSEQTDAHWRLGGARVAFRDLAVWQRRLSVDETRQIFHCNNYEKPREFLANQRAPPIEEQAIPFPEENVVAPKNGGYCSAVVDTVLSGSSCNDMIDDLAHSFLGSGRTIWAVLSFARPYVVNKVMFKQGPVAQTLTLTFSDGQTFEFRLLNSNEFQEILFEDKSTHSINFTVLSAGPQSGIAEVGVFYDHSRDRIPSPALNLAASSSVTYLDSVPVPGQITDGVIAGDFVFSIEIPSNPPPVGANDLSTIWITINFRQEILANFVRFWMLNDTRVSDHLKNVTMQFSDDSYIEFNLLLPTTDDAYYWSEFLFTPTRTQWLKFYVTETYESTNKKTALSEIEIFYDSSKDLPASYTIIDEHSNWTSDSDLSNVKLGMFDFLLTVSVKATDHGSVLGRKSPTYYHYKLRFNYFHHIYFRVGLKRISSVTKLLDNQWHNIKVFYNARESEISLFIDNRLEARLTTLLPKDEDNDWQWVTGGSLGDSFTGVMRNLKVYHGVRNLGIETMKITDSAMSASSMADAHSGPEKARLNGAGTWSPLTSDSSQYLQVDLGMSRNIVYLGFQGRENAYIRSAKISYSNDGLEWQYFLDQHNVSQAFMASTDADSVAMVLLYRAVVARYLRIYPVDWMSHIALRIEVYEFDYGLPHNEVPSYVGCVAREGLSLVFPQSSYTTEAATPFDCQSACQRDYFTHAGLYHGSVCACLAAKPELPYLPNDLCSSPCSGNAVTRCGGKSSVSVYTVLGDPPMLDFDVEITVGSPSLCFDEANIVVGSSDGKLHDIDVSYNGVNYDSVTPGNISRVLTIPGDTFVVAESRDSAGGLVTAMSRKVSVVRKPAGYVLYCPVRAHDGVDFKCNSALERGSHLKWGWTMNGRNVSLDVDDNLVATTGALTLDAPVVFFNDSVSSITVLSEHMFLKSGEVEAFDLIASRPGNVTIQILRPVCNETKAYCYTYTACINRGVRCLSTNPIKTSVTFPSTDEFCDITDPYCPKRTPSTVLTDLSLQSEQTFVVTQAGFNILVPEQLHVKSGDYLAFTNSDIVVHQAIGTSFRSEEGISGEDKLISKSSLVLVQGRSPLLRAHYSVHQRLSFTLNQTGVVTSTFSNVFGSKYSSETIKRFVMIEDVEIFAPNISATNAIVFFTIPVFPGDGLRLSFDFGDGHRSEISTEDMSRTLVIRHEYTSSGIMHFLFSVTNPVNSFSYSQDILILDPIQGLDWSCLVYTVNQSTVVTWSATRGQNTAVRVRFGDGASTLLGPYDLTSGVIYSVEHTYEALGEYNISLDAVNPVSTAHLNGLLSIVFPLQNLTVQLNTSSFMVGETVTIRARVARGTGLKYSATFKCQHNGDILLKLDFTEDTLVTSFSEACVYDYNISVSNWVSGEWLNGTITIEAYVIANLRVSVQPTVLTSPSVFTLEVDSGKRFNCTWDFGDGSTSVTPYSSYGTPVNHVYSVAGEYTLNVSCSNHVSKANTSTAVLVLTLISNLQITAVSSDGDTGKCTPGYENCFRLERPVLFSFATDGSHVSYTIDFGDLSKPVTTLNGSVEHQFLSAGSYRVTVNCSNAFSYKIVSMSVNLLQSVEDIVISNNELVRLRENATVLTTIGQLGTASCYYFDLGDGTHVLFKDLPETTCANEYQHVTDVRIMAPNTLTITFAHAYFSAETYHVTCTGSSPVSNVSSTSEVVVMVVLCSDPVVKIENLGQTVDTAREFTRPDDFEILSKNTIDCEASSKTELLWKIFQVNDTKSEMNKLEVLAPGLDMDQWRLIVKPRSIPYGVYKVSFTVTMLGVVGFSSTTFGYLKILSSELVAEIGGGSSRVVGFNKTLLLDGGLSRDPDVEAGNFEGMSFFWSCKRDDDNYTFPDDPEPLRSTNHTTSHPADYGGCFGDGPGRLNYSMSASKMSLDTGLMRENSSYFIQLLVKKDIRKNLFSIVLEIIPGNPPTIALGCLKNCFQKFNPSMKISIGVTCQDCTHVYALNYRWQMFVDANGAGDWVSVNTLADVILTHTSSPNLVIKEGSLEGNKTYKIRAQVWRPGGLPGMTELIRTVNVAPSGGWCFASPSTGFTLDTPFNVTCDGWWDDNLPLRYAFSYFAGSDGVESLFYVGERSKCTNITLPIGQKSNYTLDIVVLVSDSLGASSSVRLTVQVKPSSGNSLKSKLESLTSPDGRIGTLVSSGDTQGALQMITVVGAILNVESKTGVTSATDDTTSGTADSETYTKIRTRLVNTTSIARVETLHDAHKTAAVVNIVTMETGQVSVEAQETASSILVTASNVLASEAGKGTTDPAAVQKAAEALLSGVGNVLSAAFAVVDEGSIIDEDNGSKEDLANTLISAIESVAKAVIWDKAPGEEPTRIETPHLSLEVYRETPEELKFKVLKAGSGSFELPNLDGILKDSKTIDISTFATRNNPFPDNANRIKSVVLTTALRNASGVITVTNLEKPIDIRLPRDPKPVSSSKPIEITASKMVFYKFDIKHNDSSVNIELHPIGNCSDRANFSLFLRREQRPTVLNYDFNTTIPEEISSDMDNGKGTKDPYTFFVSNVDFNHTAAGRYYLGLIYNRPDGYCPDAMNYTIDIYTSGCLYWNELSKTWQGDGCLVGRLTNFNMTQCLCNHLTSFGSDFVVAPNSIDWNAVGAGFANLGDNPVVFATVMSIIGLYFILLLWTRRRDKKDLEEFITIPLPDNDPRDSYNYEVVVYTGHSKYTGSTAKVMLVIVGNLDETEPRGLADSTNTALKPGGVDTFLLSVPSTLGRLSHIRIWHDNTGESPSWFLSRILIRDLQTDRKTWFICGQWLAVEEDDGLIERTLVPATKEDLVSFNFLFSIEARRKLLDEHLWFSVLARRPRSQFTRVQRLSCCLSVLLTSMLANAMFYQDGASSSGGEIRAGPIVISAKQLWIAFISSMVVLPANLLIVYLFRNVRPRSSADTSPGEQLPAGVGKYAAGNEDGEVGSVADSTTIKVSCSKDSSPPKFVYVAYALVFLTASVSATFTIFYGFTFGKEKSERWISSTMLSFFQDLLLSQPLKVFAAATFIALIIKDPNKVDQGDKSDDKPELLEQVDETLVDEEEAKSSEGKDSDKTPRAKSARVVIKPPNEADLVAVRELRKKQKKMRGIISEVCWYLAYLMLICIVAYGNRDPKAFHVTRTMNDMFVENAYTSKLSLNDVSNIPKYWSWLYNSVLPAISTPYWYGPHGLAAIETSSKTSGSKSRGKAKTKSTKTKSSGSSDSQDTAVFHDYPKGFTADRAVSYIVGQARARQLRNAQQDSCYVQPVVRHFLRGCSDEYSWSNEDEGCYDVSWTPINESKKECRERNPKSAWSYHTAWDLKGTPFWGKFHNYWGGGFVVELGSTLSEIQQESNRLEKEGWVDQHTRAIFLEFTIYNAFTNFFCSVTLLMERQITGGLFPYGQLHTLRLYHYVGPEAFVTLVCEIIFVGVLCYNFARELKEARIMGIKNYFRDPWNYFDILGLIFSFTAVALYFVRIAATSLALKSINESRETFVSFHYISAIDQSFTYLMGFAVFVYFLKLLRLLRFNRRVSLLSTTLIACIETLVGFLFVYMLLFAAYGQLMYLVYGRDLEDYASFPRCLSSLMEMTLGATDFDGMNNVNRVLTGFVFFSYTFLNVCVYMNLFISILSEKFTEVRGDASLQPNDYEIVDFIVLSLKKACGSLVGPAPRAIYKEPKDKIERGVEKIEDTSECIQSAIQVLCKEDIRQTLWFSSSHKIEEKKLLLSILLETGELWTENDIGDAVPLFDDMLKKFTLEDLQVMQEKQRKWMAEEEQEEKNSTLMGWLQSVGQNTNRDSREASEYEGHPSCSNLSDVQEDEMSGGSVGDSGSVRELRGGDEAHEESGDEDWPGAIGASYNRVSSDDDSDMERDDYYDDSGDDGDNGGGDVGGGDVSYGDGDDGRGGGDGGDDDGSDGGDGNDGDSLGKDGGGDNSDIEDHDNLNHCKNFDREDDNHSDGDGHSDNGDELSPRRSPYVVSISEKDGRNEDGASR